VTVTSLTRIWMAGHETTVESVAEVPDSCPPEQVVGYLEQGELAVREAVARRLGYEG